MICTCQPPKISWQTSVQACSTLFDFSSFWITSKQTFFSGLRFSVYIYWKHSEIFFFLFPLILWIIHTIINNGFVNFFSIIVWKRLLSPARDVVATSRKPPVRSTTQHMSTRRHSVTYWPRPSCQNRKCICVNNSFKLFRSRNIRI